MNTLIKALADTRQYVTYVYKGITYVPHYNRSFYVGPGYTIHSGYYDRDGVRIYTADPSKEFTAEELINAGAKRVVRLLWTRAGHAEVRNGYPRCSD